MHFPCYLNLHHHNYWHHYMIYSHLYYLMSLSIEHDSSIPGPDYIFLQHSVLHKLVTAWSVEMNDLRNYLAGVTGGVTAKPYEMTVTFTCEIHYFDLGNSLLRIQTDKGRKGPTRKNHPRLCYRSCCPKPALWTNKTTNDRSIKCYSVLWMCQRDVGR